MKPEIVIFDEPTAGLDPVGRDTIFKAINDYKTRYNATVIIVSHSMEDIAEFTDKILVMNRGKVALIGTTKQVFENSKLLKNLGLGVPQITDVFEKLNKLYPGFDARPLTVEDAVSSIKELLLSGGSSHA